MVGHGGMWVGGVSSSLWRKAILSPRSSFRCTKVPDLIFAIYQFFWYWWKRRGQYHWGGLWCRSGGHESRERYQRDVWEFLGGLCIHGG